MGRICQLEKSQIGGTTYQGGSLVRAVLTAASLPSTMVARAASRAAWLGSSTGHPVVLVTATATREP
jgi:hypothetical protein